MESLGENYDKKKWQPLTGKYGPMPHGDCQLRVAKEGHRVHLGLGGPARLQQEGTFLQQL